MGKGRTHRGVITHIYKSSESIESQIWLCESIFHAIFSTPPIFLLHLFVAWVCSCWQCCIHVYLFAQQELGNAPRPEPEKASK